MQHQEETATARNSNRLPKKPDRGTVEAGAIPLQVGWDFYHFYCSACSLKSYLQSSSFWVVSLTITLVHQH